MIVILILSITYVRILTKPQTFSYTRYFFSSCSELNKFENYAELNGKTKDLNLQDEA